MNSVRGMKIMILWLGKKRSLGLANRDVGAADEPKRPSQDPAPPPRRRSSIIDAGKALGLAILDKGSRRIIIFYLLANQYLNKITYCTMFCSNCDDIKSWMFKGGFRTHVIFYIWIWIRLTLAYSPKLFCYSCCCFS